MLIEQGLSLMAYGMGTVFVFLTVLVLITSAMSSLVTRYLPESAPPAKPRARGQAAAVEDAHLVAAITAAIHHHRDRQK